MTIETVVFPVAGKGTRFRPATLGTPKELLPVIDTPLLQFSIDEALEAGAKHLIFVTSPDKPGIAHYLDATGVAGKCEVTVLMQTEQLGLGHAVNCARDSVGNRRFGVILPDDLIVAPQGCLAQMAALEHDGHSFAAIQEVSREDTDRYGIMDVSEQVGNIHHALSIVEKPAPEEAPSCLGVVGRYILEPAVFDHLAENRRGSGGEIQLTDALEKMIGAKGLAGYAFSGRRFDCGTPEGMLEATLAYARQKPSLRAVLNEQTDMANAA